MSSDLVPFAPRPVSDISRFEHFTVATHKMTGHEKVIYRRLASDWAQLDATAQTTLYAAFLQGRLTKYLREIFADTLEETYDELLRFSDPEPRGMMKNFNTAMLQQDAQILLGFKMTAARKTDAILAQDYPDEAPKANLWQRILGREA